MHEVNQTVARHTQLSDASEPRCFKPSDLISSRLDSPQPATTFPRTHPSTSTSRASRPTRTSGASRGRSGPSAGSTPTAPSSSTRASCRSRPAGASASARWWPRRTCSSTSPRSCSAIASSSRRRAPRSRWRTRAACSWSAVRSSCVWSADKPSGWTGKRLFYGGTAILWTRQQLRAGLECEIPDSKPDPNIFFVLFNLEQVLYRRTYGKTSQKHIF